jgi:hypothetical protein
VRWEKRDVEAGSDEAEDKAEDKYDEMESSRAVALGLNKEGILIGWRVVMENEDLSLYAVC